MRAADFVDVRAGSSADYEMAQALRRLAAAEAPAVVIAADVAQQLVELLTPVRWVPEEVRMPPGYSQRFQLPSVASPAFNLVLEAHAPGDGASMLLRLSTVDGQPIWQTLLYWAPGKT